MSLTATGATPVSLAGRSLAWRVLAPWTRPSWELRDDERVLATVRRAHWYGGTMIAEVEGARWRLGRIGWFEVGLTPDGAARPSLIQRGFGWPTDETTQRLRLSRWRGDAPIERADGHRWYWRQHGFVRDVRWEVLDERECALAVFTRTHRPFRIEGAVQIGDETESRAEALEAAVFGWYLLLRETARRSHAAAAGGH